MKGENNSLKKKVQSLQIDYDKLSRKVSTTQARSSGESNSGEGAAFSGSQSDHKQTVNSEKQQLGTLGAVDLHNQSIQSDYVHSQLRPDNKLDNFPFGDLMQQRIMRDDSKKRDKLELGELANNDSNEQHSPKPRTISLSDNEEEANADGNHRNDHRKGEFAFDPLGPETLNDMD